MRWLLQSLALPLPMTHIVPRFYSRYVGAFFYPAPSFDARTASSPTLCLSLVFEAVVVVVASALGTAPD